MAVSRLTMARSAADSTARWVDSGELGSAASRAPSSRSKWTSPPKAKVTAFPDPRSWSGGRAAVLSEEVPSVDPASPDPVSPVCPAAWPVPAAGSSPAVPDPLLPQATASTTSATSTAPARANSPPAPDRIAPFGPSVGSSGHRARRRAYPPPCGVDRHRAHSLSPEPPTAVYDLRLSAGPTSSRPPE